MAHGYAGTKYHGLEPMAEAFAEAGFLVLVHDHRGFGDSGGEPRQDVETHRLDETQVKEFAIQFDPQPFHTDQQVAERTFFNGLAASGWHTAAITMRLNVESGQPLAGGIVGAGVELSWPTPTRPGDVLHVESEVVEITPSRSRPDRSTIVLLSRKINQRGDVVQFSRPNLLFRAESRGESTSAPDSTWRTSLIRQTTALRQKWPVASTLLGE